MVIARFIVVGTLLFLVYKTPLVLGGLFLGLLLFSSLCLGFVGGFIGLILFIVYVGGTIVLFTYCFIISPRHILGGKTRLYSFLLLLIGINTLWPHIGNIQDFYWVRNALLLIGILLFIRILRVVEIVDFSRGSLRVECDNDAS